MGDTKKVILALTPASLTNENRDCFLIQVTANNIGGLYIWNFSVLKTSDLDVILSKILGYFGNLKLPSLGKLYCDAKVRMQNKRIDSNNE